MNYTCDADGAGVFGQRFDAAGAPLGGEFGANSVKFGDQIQPRVAMDGAGGFVVVWQSPDANGTGIFARRFGSAGQPYGFEFPVNSYTTGDQITPDASTDAGGRFFLWSTDDAPCNSRP